MQCLLVVLSRMSLSPILATLYGFSQYFISTDARMISRSCVAQTHKHVCLNEFNSSTKAAAGSF